MNKTAQTYNNDRKVEQKADDAEKCEFALTSISSLHAIYNLPAATYEATHNSERKFAFVAIYSLCTHRRK
ncbi:hypothetical protein Bpfe_014803 [Biomphalaria pfeifferi]|uniref:Uncharacterized protein n=1 Tax=Biomphalaria pfeifferi TaxID=112525 RepID=A0AAD8BJG6_BIOPF|nr:hypothetical protein Bpfe_014803 [Biomphalaria pfeifferi]